MNTDLFFEQFDVLAEAPNGVEKLRELVLQMAIQGMLVSQELNDYPAKLILSRAEKEKRQANPQRRMEASKVLAPITSDELPFSLPIIYHLNLNILQIVGSLLVKLQRPGRHRAADD